MAGNIVLNRLSAVILLSLLPQGAVALQPSSLDALRQGDCRAALADTAAPGRPAEALAIAQCQIRAGDVEVALATLTPVTATDLSGYAALLAAEALLARGDAAMAAGRLQGVSLPGGAGERVAMVRGRALIESGDLAGGRDSLRPLLTTKAAAAGALPTPGGADPAEVRWWLAEGAVRRGDTPAAVPVWQQLWARNPTSPRAEDAAARLAKAGVTVPDPSSSEGRALIAARIKALGKLQGWSEALALRESLPTGDAHRTTSALARACFRAKDYPRAAALFAKLPSPSLKQSFDHALALSRADDYAGAADHYRALRDRAPTSAEGQYADFKVAYLSYDAGASDPAELKKAIPLFQAHLSRYPKAKRAAEAKWFIGWAQYRLDQLDAANETLGGLVAHHSSSDLAAAARYWQARIAHRQGDEATAQAGYRDVLGRWPASGYGWFAAWRLGKTWSPRGDVADPPVPESMNTPAFRRGRALAAVGLSTWAAAELSTVSVRRDDRAARLAVAFTANDYPLTQQLSHCARARWRSDLKELSTCLPRPMGDVTARAALAGGLPRNLPYAIMTAESALRAGVASPAGARGLMQLMPSLAASLHPKRFGDQPFDPDQLFQPGYNAALGVDELASLHKRLQDAGVEPALPLVIAGYNAGEDAVRRWLATYPTPPEPDRFAEDISYTETRRYVRRVLGTLQVYRMAYGDG
jgi:soluble lytic murein transglycosylase-like protein